MDAMMKFAITFLLLVAVAAAHTAPRTDMRIVGGHNVPNPNPYPWVAQLSFKCGPSGSVFRCTGSVLQENALLTAAHCFPEDCEDVYAGVAVGRSSENPDEVVGVQSITRHQDYDAVKVENDIAVWVLSDPLTTVKKYPYLPSGGVNTGLSVIAAGYGKTSTSGSLTNILQMVTLEVQPDGYCNNVFNDYNSDTQICAGQDDGRDTCGGDSGGPLFTTEDCCYYQHSTLRGITSYGAEDCGALTGAVYTDVSQFTDWIQTTLAANDAPYQNPGDQCCQCDGSSGDIGNVIEDGCTLSWASHLSVPLLFVVIVGLLGAQF
jgi:trypsin